MFRLQLKDFFKFQSTIIHEFIHALGLYHVQSREDRDKYVEIKWDNIQEKAKHNFKIHKGSRTFGVPYDPLSIMHYFFYAFAKDSSKLYEYGLDLFCDPSFRSLNNNIRHATFVMSTRYSF